MSSMSKEEILTKLKPLVAEQLGVEESQVTEDASFTEDLNADSLDLVELIMSLEEQYKLQISDEDAEKITTVGEAVDYISDHMS
ncbi:MAG TPA: acyl carrier protein [Ktedonobacterales bacterium]|nr:acyl carrier protein [Ktedonobacterales bacterium]